MMPDVVSESLECVDKLVKSIGGLNKERKERILDSFRTRARTVPTYVFTRGVAYALTFIAARGSSEAVVKGLTATSCEQAINDVIEKARNIGEDELGYWLYSSVIAYVMKSAKIVSSSTFKDLIKEVMENPAVNFKAKGVFEWVKRFAEAYISGGT